MYEYMGLGWFIVGLIVAWYLYKVAPEKTKILWAIIGFFFSVITIIVWYLIGPSGKLKHILP